jgi:hypothetical protein
MKDGVERALSGLKKSKSRDGSMLLLSRLAERSNMLRDVEYWSNGRP